jgi:hypothetical protein
VCRLLLQIVVLDVSPGHARKMASAGAAVEASGTPLADHHSCLRRRNPTRDVFAMVASARIRTVSDWTDEGYRGLRILNCTSCRTMTWRTWDQLQAHGTEEVLAVAQRFHCGKCDQIPAGLPVVVSTGR